MDDFLDDSYDSGTSSSALTALLNTAAQVGTTALVANSSQPIVVQGPGGLISNTPGVVASSSSMTLWIFIAIFAAIVLIVLIR